MPTHPLWRPYAIPDDAEVARARVQPHVPAAIEVVPPDPAWPAAFEQVRSRIVAALGERAVHVEHVGSTSVPGLWAKPVIDVDVAVGDSGDEPAYLPDLETAGFGLRGRQPDWEQHRFLRGHDPVCNVHVFSVGSPESRRMSLFRDWLRTHPEDRQAYGDLKRALATRGFTDVMHYNNAKAALVYDIHERIFLADPDSPHDPRPR